MITYLSSMITWVSVGVPPLCPYALCISTSHLFHPLVLFYTMSHESEMSTVASPFICHMGAKWLKLIRHLSFPWSSFLDRKCGLPHSKTFSEKLNLHGRCFIPEQVF